MKKATLKRKVLLLSYHSLPMDVIASYRTKAYLDFFPDHGIEVTLLTHRWEKEEMGSWLYHNQNSKVEEEAGSNYRIIRLPRQRHSANRWRHLFFMNSFLRKILILYDWMNGDLDADPNLYDSYRSYRSFLIKHLEFNQYDLVISVFSPHFHHKLAHKIEKRFGIPYVLDFRDLWNNRVIHTSYTPKTTEKIQDYLTKVWWKKWLARSLFFTITSNTWARLLGSLTSTNGFTIYNGFEEELFSKKHEIIKKNRHFEILHAGNLYSHQKLNIFFEGVRAFIREKGSDSIRIRFIGADRGHNTQQLSGYLQNAKKVLLEQLDSSYCEVTKRIPKSELLSEYARADVLFFPSFPDSPGTHAGKIFDYLGAAKNILVVPDDGDVACDLIKRTNAGRVANTPKEVYECLVHFHSEWKSVGIQYLGKMNIIKKYTREHQVSRMAELVKEHLNSQDLT